MALLRTISGPSDLKRLTPSQVDVLADEIRDYLIHSVSRTGGHLGPNLGVVELTIALHRVFDSPRDTILFDTGHIGYVHKLLTGRHDFSTLRKEGGLSGYPSRAESDHDVIENSHASTSLSWALGIANGRRLRGESDRHTVAVIGDGALTGGMVWEALNNIAENRDLPLIIVINDNERSYAATRGGMADYLASLRAKPGYENMLSWGKRQLNRTPVVGKQVYETLHGMKKGLKDIVSPQGMFEDLGLKYLGPVDGHDVEAMETALRRAHDFGGVVLVHAITEKGHGYDPATADEADRFHAVGKINPETGLPLELSGRSWTDEFSDELVRLGKERDDIVALTAAMLIPVGLQPFAERFPDRVFDVGIAEQHAVTMAAGLSFTGLHPVVCVYATFLNRAFDQLLMDCALHGQGVTFVLDRAGVTGTDGASHNGMWDLRLLGLVPGVRVAAPRDGQQVALALREAVAVDDAPTVVRFPKGTVGAPLEAVRTVGGVDVLRDPMPAFGADEGAADESGDEAGAAGQPVDLLLVGVGSMAATSLEVADKLEAQGRSVRVVDPRWVLPVSPDLVDLARSAGAVAVVEDGLVGGVGDRVAQAFSEAGLTVPVHAYGLPHQFLDHGSRDQVLERVGLTADSVATSLVARLAPA
ncbi:1-deoxy-D-xylulose-5-phosphate synthase [Ornithinimicrobium humiphilum]|uniref:1-deoxy-D-xylulose-5-phosphate synthase n=1 Tax=Ornithinimicrobium humiphilum TaxID=125288 RepID=A0A543KNE1_9MICO|nr:1-deoxy-D-xylulose-5-phosphate synthase [Ornithinimicrobium humiphilum]TQM96590.1 1-deoxy-D-xylulose-5-phosphate synthase [Ornithinimicrobium humiphilum]